MRGCDVTYVGGNARKNDLRTVGGNDRVAEVLVVPGVDLSLTLDEGRIRVHVDDLVRDESVGACSMGEHTATQKKRKILPDSELEVITVGRSNTLASAA